MRSIGGRTQDLFLTGAANSGILNKDRENYLLFFPS